MLYTFTSEINSYMVHITSKKPNCRFSDYHLKVEEDLTAFLHFRHKISSSCKPATTSFCISNREPSIPILITSFNCLTSVAYCVHILKFFLGYHPEVQIFNLHFTDANWEQSQIFLPGVQNQSVPLPFGAHTTSMPCKASYISAFLTLLT